VEDRICASLNVRFERSRCSLSRTNYKSPDSSHRQAVAGGLVE
jgi:hypothetical protein